MSENRPAIKRVATLDLLRLASAMAVVLFHYLYRGAAGDEGYLASGYPSAESWAIYGYLGVVQFFLISGFVIAWSAEGRRWEEFALARFARLYPGFLTCMTITFGVTLWAAMPPFETSIAQYLANLVMFSPALGQPFMDGVYWSIILEVIFYGWVALAVFFGVFERWKFELLGVWLAVILINEQIIGSGAARLLFLTEFGPFFVGGVLLHHLFAHGRSNIVLVMLGASFLISCNGLLIGREWMLENYGSAVSVPDLVIANIIMHGLMIASVRWRDILPSNYTILMIGGLTYPLYLLHQHIGYIFINLLAPVLGGWTAVLAVIGIMLLLSWAVWRFIETPSRRWIMRTMMPIVETVVGRFRKTPLQAAE